MDHVDNVRFNRQVPNRETTPQPRKQVRAPRARQLFEETQVGSSRRVRFRLRDEHDLRPACGVSRQRGQDQQELIDGSQSIWANQDGQRPQRGDEIARIEVLAERAEEAPGPLDQEALAAGGGMGDSPHNLLHAD